MAPLAPGAAGAAGRARLENIEKSRFKNLGSKMTILNKKTTIKLENPTNAFFFLFCAIS